MADIIDVHYQSLHSFQTTSKVRVESPGNVEMGGKIDSIRLCVAPKWKTALRFLSYICTGFIMYLFNLWIPKLSVAMSFSDSNLRKAKKVIVYGADKNIEVVNLLTETTSTQTLKVFTYRLFKYYYDEKEQAFKPCQFKIDHLTFSQVHETYGQGLEEEHYRDNSTFFGKNLTDIPKKSCTTLLFQEVLSPFYIFQVYSVIVWAFDDYWVYGIMIIFFSVSSVAVTLYQTIKTTNKLQQMSYYEIPVYVHRKVNGVTNRVQVNSSELVPGDLMEIPEGVMMPCDAVILNGTCIMNEAMLTGESIPVIKNPFPMSDTYYNPKEDKQYTLYAGTKCIQARYYQGTAVFGLVTLTGFATVKGELIRTMLFPKPTDFKFYSDSFKFVGILAVVAICGFLIDLPAWVNSNQDGMTETIIIKASEIITITVPPALPTCMQIGVSVALARLKVKQIFCISPGKINEAGRVNVMCFDKTGTLTEDGLDLLGVRPVIYDKNSKKLGFSKLVKKITTLSTPNTANKDLELQNLISKSQPATIGLYEKTKLLPSEQMLEILATCHSLTMVNGKMIGDPLDLKMFECTKWSLDEELNQFDNENRILARALPLLQSDIENQSPLQNTTNQSGTGILRRYEFSSKLQRMSVIVKNFTDNTYKVHVKGSPEKIRELCRPETVPINFHFVLEKYAREGYRVLACATKLLEPIHRISSVTRDDVEKDFTFIGLLIMENKLKPITTQIIHQLHEAQIRTIMVTGDNALTAISVARQCNIINPAQRVFLGDLSEKKVDGKDVIQWKDFEFADRVLNNNLDLDIETESQLVGSFGLNTSGRMLRISGNGINLSPATEEIDISRRAKSRTDSMARDRVLETSMRTSRPRMTTTLSGAGHTSRVSGARLSQAPQTPAEINANNKKMLTSSANIVEVDAPFFSVDEEENYCIAVTGKAFSLILHEAEVKKNAQYQYILQQLLRKCLVFARMHPDEKALMIKHMMAISSNNIVGMCGDGANDVGALKTANVGVSLSEAEASIAAPFTSNIQDISCIPTLLREGRAALSTSYQAFKFMALYSIIQFSSVTLLFHELIDLTNWHYYHIDMLIILPLSATMALTPTSDELTMYKPTGRLISVQILSSVLGQGLIQILFQLGTLLILLNKSWYNDYHNQCLDDFATHDPCIENTSLYLVSIYQYCAVAMVFMVGRPFKKPFYTNLWFTCIWSAQILINLIMLYNPFKFGFVTDISWEAEVETSPSWKNEIMIIVILNCIGTIVWERLIVKHVSVWWKSHRDAKQRAKEEQELQLQGNKINTSDPCLLNE